MISASTQPDSYVTKRTRPITIGGHVQKRLIEDLNSLIDLVPAGSVFVVRLMSFLHSFQSEVSGKFGSMDCLLRCSFC